MRALRLVRVLTVSLGLASLWSCSAPDSPEAEAVELGLSTLAVGAVPTQCASFPPNRILLGTDGPDTITGTNAAECIITYGGNDVVDARGGNDFIVTGRGNDAVQAGDGQDTVYLGPGDDEARGGKGDDGIHGEQGATESTATMVPTCCEAARTRTTSRAVARRT
jgi:hypothetical protein